MNDSDGLSEAACAVWGKSGDGSSAWLPLWRHLADSAAIAGQLWDSWVPAAVRRLISRELPGADLDGRRLTCWLAGVHDIGKATPSFASQVPVLANRMRDHGFAFDAQLKDNRKFAPHATSGHLVLADWLERRHRWNRSRTGQFAIVVGGHHGVPPADSDLLHVHDRPYLVGTERVWHDTRDEVLEWMATRVDVSDRLAEWRDVELSQPVQSLLTGLVIVADWIASNEEFFPYGARALDPDRVGQAWRSLDLPEPWHAVAVTDDNANLFAARFALPAGTRPYPVQDAVVDAAREMPLPGLLIVEAPMGEGKTEAAFAAIEVLAARNGAGGCFVALPTRATADAMFGRALAWWPAVPDQDIGRGAHGVTLVHGKAGLNPEFSALRWKALPSAIGIDEGGADIAAHRWLAGRKRHMLASFAVGTIDQLLFAALKSRHLVLRHLGLAGKVVVVDEAHAYDVYMSSYLDRALHWLGAFGVSVVVLSATLPAGRRAKMMAAYDDGRLGALPRRRARWGSQLAADADAAEFDSYEKLRQDRRYPIVTRSGRGRDPVTRQCASSGRATAVRLSTHDDDPVKLAHTLRTELVDGGCVLVVCNTVTRVQETASVLRAQWGSSIPVSLAHSRFMATDRASKDRWLRDTFGPPSHQAAVGRARPACHVVVASQVAEQSLDIDFDLLVTDLAPVDLLLQRMGRLHRHTRAERPTRLTKPKCLLRGADWATVPPEPARGSVRVYDRAALLRSAAVLLPHLEPGHPVALPGDISTLVQTAYGDEPVGPPPWQATLAGAATAATTRMHEKQQRANAFRLGPVGEPGLPLVGWLTAGAGDVESMADDSRGRAHVRDDSGEVLDVLVLVRRNGQLVTPPWLASDGGTVVPTDSPPDPSLARTIAMCTLSLPQAMTSRGIDQIIAELEKRNAISAWQDNHWLAGELILDLDERGRAEVAGHALEYDPHDGLRVTRLDQPSPLSDP